MLCVVMLSVAFDFFIAMLIVNMLNVIMLSVVAPISYCQSVEIFNYLKFKKSRICKNNNLNTTFLF
jgi:hypothetical protein